MFEKGLVVSLPGAGAAGLRLPGSVFRLEELGQVVLPPELRLALLLLAEAVEGRRVPKLVVARPEIFTHGPLLDRLRARLGDIEDHVALCDGTAFRPVPGLRNHLFFYRRSMPEACGALRRLVEVAPEMFQGLASQVNGALAFRLDGRWHRPPPLLLGFARTPRTDVAELLPVHCNPANPAASAARSVAEAADAPPEEPDARPLRCVPLSEGLLADAEAMRLLARLLLSAWGRAERLLVLQLPPALWDRQEVADQVALVVEALGRTGLVFPRHAAASARWATAPLEPERLEGGSLVLHPGFDFWRIGRDTWRSVAAVELLGSGPQARGSARLLRAWLGEAPPVAPLDPAQARRVRVSDWL